MAGHLPLVLLFVIVRTAKNEKKKISGKTGPVGATQWKNG